MFASLSLGWGLRARVDNLEVIALRERAVELTGAAQATRDMIGIVRTQEIRDPEKWFPVIEELLDQLAKAIAEFQGVPTDGRKD